MNLTRNEKAALRATIFQHLDGIGTAPTVHVLHKSGILNYLKEQERTDLASLTKAFKTNEGYLNVALKILCSQGWLMQEIRADEQNIVFTITEKGKVANDYAGLYREAVDFIPFAIKMEDYISVLRPLRQKNSRNTTNN